MLHLTDLLIYATESFCYFRSIFYSCRYIYNSFITILLQYRLLFNRYGIGHHSFRCCVSPMRFLVTTLASYGSSRASISFLLLGVSNSFHIPAFPTYSGLHIDLVCSMDFTTISYDSVHHN